MKGKCNICLTIFFLFIVIVNQSFAGDGHHHFGAFIGMTNNIDLEHTDITLGADYEYRVSEAFGAGFIADFVFADHAESIFFAGLFYHVTPNLKFTLGNGIAMAEHVVHVEASDHRTLFKSSDDEPETEIATETETHYALRVGAEYDFHVGAFSISPTLNWDLINKHSSIAYGITFGYGF